MGGISKIKQSKHKLGRFHPCPFLLLALVFILTACAPSSALLDFTPTPTPSPREQAAPKFDVKNYDIISKIDGSTATIPLSEEILLELLGTFEGLNHNRTHEAYINLISGVSDLIFVTYPSEEEFAEAERNGVELEIIPVVKDALVFLKNTNNRVESLTQKEIRGIYTGEIINWRDVGGENMPLLAFQRPDNSGSQTLFLKLAMDGLTPSDPPTELRPMDMGGLVDSVASYNNTANALGYSVFYYVSDMYGSPDVSLMGIDGIVPTRETIAAGTYPYITCYYAVMRKDTPEDHPMRELVSWLLGDDGQAVAQRAGYVPMRVLNPRLDVSGYGFYGSTPENTTMSSGTGGTRYGDMDVFSGKWRSIIDYYNVDLSSDPEIERVVSSFVKQTEESLGDYESCNTSYEILGDLLSVIVYAYYEDSTWSTVSAIFDLSSGKRLRLSDLFYDGVNYIEYINANLISDNSPNMLYMYIPDGSTFAEYYLKRPFTGIPNDYSNFHIRFNSDGPALCVIIDRDNPFFDYPQELTLWLNLPMDLSPWGLIFKKDFDRIDINDKLEILIPRIQTCSKPSAVDEVINAKVRAIAETASEMKVDVSWVQPGEKASIQPIFSVWNDNATFSYRDFYGWDDVGARHDFTVSVNLRTGETVNPADYIPDNWTGGAQYVDANGQWQFIHEYIPPEGYQVENVLIQSWGHFSLTVIEPDGRRLYVGVSELR